MQTVHRRIAVHNGRLAVAFVQPWVEEKIGLDDDGNVPAPGVVKGYTALVRLTDGTAVTGKGDSIEEAVDDVAQRI